jgi:hypothetical protein
MKIEATLNQPITMECDCQDVVNALNCQHELKQRHVTATLKLVYKHHRDRNILDTEVQIKRWAEPARPWSMATKETATSIPAGTLVQS